MKRTRTLTAETLLLRLAPLLLVWAGLFAYAGRPIVVAAAHRGVGPALAWGAVLFMAMLSLVPILSGSGSHPARKLLSWAGYATMSLFSSLFVLVALRDLAHVAFNAAGAIAAAASLELSWTPPGVTVTSRALLFLAGGLAFLGLLQARHPRVRRVKVPVAGLPSQLEGFRIVQLSDLHVGPTIQKGFIRCVVDRVNRLRPDAVVITGDLIDGPVSQLAREIAPLADLETVDGVFWVTGNHEYYWNANDWIRALGKLGLRNLANANQFVRRGEAILAFAGINDPAAKGADRPDLERAMAGIPPSAIKVLLSHRPQTARLASREGVHLQLSGHTHGGQFFPFNLLIRWFQPVVRGLHKVDRTWLYVSRGTGYWGPPSRLGVGGEVTLIELTRG